jgi:protein phosphatase
MVDAMADEDRVIDREAQVISIGEASLEIAAVSDIGVSRAENQDGWRIVITKTGAALILADGMGGHSGGGEAAQAALDAAAAVLGAADSPLDSLIEAFAAADAAVGELRSGGGTTLVAAVIQGSSVKVGNVGDSRAYLLHQSKLQQLTDDHSFAAEQIRAGLITPDDPAAKFGRNRLTRAVTGSGSAPDIYELDVSHGDLLKLCSDGLWGELEHTHLEQILLGKQEVDELVDSARRAALDAGTTDNVTVVIGRWTTE